MPLMRRTAFLHWVSAGYQPPDDADTPAAADDVLAWLESVSIVYVLLPVVLFLYWWLQPSIGIPLAILVLAAAAAAVREAWRPPGVPSHLRSSFTGWRGTLGHLVVIAMVMLLVGLSPLGFSRYWREGGDYLKHIAFLHDLSMAELPTRVPGWGHLAKIGRAHV